jgi:hypothetical protein
MLARVVVITALLERTPITEPLNALRVQPELTAAVDSHHAAHVQQANINRTQVLAAACLVCLAPIVSKADQIAMLVLQAHIRYQVVQADVRDARLARIVKAENPHALHVPQELTALKVAHRLVEVDSANVGPTQQLAVEQPLHA